MALEYLFVSLLGLVIGSFLSAYTYRFPRGMSIVKGRSICPNCRKKISWYDNIPLFSYILLGGKCRNCSKPISIRYPATEFITALLFVFIFYYSNNLTMLGIPIQGQFAYLNLLGVLALPYLLFVTVILLAVTIIDLENQIIPDELVFTLFSITFLVVLFFPTETIYVRLLTAFSSGLFLLMLHLITKGKGMGLGDVKLALFGGLFFGFPNTIDWMFLSFVIGALVGLFLIIIGKAKFGKHIPFGPFLVISFILTLFWGGSLIGMYYPM